MARLTATPILMDADGWCIYQLVNNSETRYETIRVGRYNRHGDYRVERLSPTGWHHLIAGSVGTREDTVEWTNEGVANAMKVLSI